jgi:hypothetical protein
MLKAIQKLFLTDYVAHHDSEDEIITTAQKVFEDLYDWLVQK